MSVRRRTMLACSTCGGELRGRTCENGHNAYPAARIEVAELAPIVEELREADRKAFPQGKPRTNEGYYEFARSVWRLLDSLSPPPEGTSADEQ